MNEKDDTIIPEQRCPYCDYKMDRTTHAFGDAKPQCGDYSMCLNCGRIGIFNDDLTVRKPNDEERLAIVENAEITRAQVARASIVNRDLRQ